MAQAFNLTAQLNLRGPSNIKQIVSDIKRELGTVTGDIKFKIDTSSINNISKLNQSLQDLNKNLSNVAGNAQAATNAIRNFGQSVSSINGSSSKLSNNLVKTEKATVDLGTSSARTAKNISITRTEMEEFGRQSALAVRRFAAFSAVTGVFFSLNRAISNGLKSFIEFDRQLVRLQQVTGKSAEGLLSLQSEISRLSIGLGVSSDSLIQVSSTLAQAGLSAGETKAALESLAKSSLAPSFDDINQTVEGSIALMRQFSISAKDLGKALGSVNSVAAAFAVESSDIISAIQRTGGVFANASRGVSEGTDALNEFIAVFTSVRATTRESAETIATGLRTIFTRIQRQGTIEALREFGVTLTDAEGKFVGAYKAVQLLSEGLSRIDPRDLKFSQIVEELGGFRQIGKVIPLIQQFATAQEALKIAQAGQGSLTADAIKAQQSLAIQISKVREEFLTLIRSLGQSDTFQTLTRGALGLASGLIKITGALKGVLPALSILAGGAALRGLSQFAGGFIGGLRKVSQGRSSGSQNQSVAGSIGSNLGASLVGAKTEQVSRDLDQNSAALDKVSDRLDNLVSSLNNFNSNFSNISNILNTNNTLLQQSITSLTSNTNSLDNLTNAINNLNLGGGPTTIKNGGRILGFAKGGTVPGFGDTDSVPAMLTPGEFVMNRQAVNAVGSSNLDKINRGGKIIQKLWSGGATKLIPNANIKNKNNNKIGFNKADTFTIDTEKEYITLSDIDRTKGKAYAQLKGKKQEVSFPSARRGKPGQGYKEFETIVRQLGFSQQEPSNYPVDFIKNGQLFDAKNVISPVPDKDLATKALHHILKRTFSDYDYNNPSKEVLASSPALLEFTSGSKLTEGKDNIKSLPSITQLIPKYDVSKIPSKTRQEKIGKTISKITRSREAKGKTGLGFRQRALIEDQTQDTVGLAGAEVLLNANQRLSPNKKYDGGLIQKFMAGGATKSKKPKEIFGTGETTFPSRIKKKYAEEKQRAEENLKAKLAWDEYPDNERITIDESKVQEKFQQPFDRAKFIDSFKQKITRNSLFSRMADFAKFIGLPQEDLSLALPLQLDFGGSESSMWSTASFRQGARGTRPYDGYDLSKFGYGEAQQQEAYGIEKLIEAKKKELKKIEKTPLRTFDDGSFSVDNVAYSKAYDELKALQTKKYQLEDLKAKAQKAILAEQENIASSTSRGTVSFGPPLGRIPSTQNSVLYHELTHQLFKGLQGKSADSFAKYRERVNSLFSGDNDDLADAFDALTSGPGGGYSSADVVYGRSYKISQLQNMLSSYYRQGSNLSAKEPKKIPEDITKNIAGLSVRGGDAKRAREFRLLNPKVNEALLTEPYGVSQQVIDKYEDIGKEEFLTTLIQKAPELDQNLQGVLDSTLTELLGGAGIQRQQYATGGVVQRFVDGGWVKRMQQLSIKDIKSQMESLDSSLELYYTGVRKVSVDTLSEKAPFMEDVGAREVKERMQAIRDFLAVKAPAPKEKTQKKITLPKAPPGISDYLRSLIDNNKAHEITGTYNGVLRETLNRAYTGDLGPRDIETNIDRVGPKTIVSLADNINKEGYIDIPLGVLENDLKYIDKVRKLQGENVEELTPRNGYSISDMLDSIRAFQAIGLDASINTALANKKDLSISLADNSKLNKSERKRYGKGVDQPLSQFVGSLDAAMQFSLPKTLFSGIGESKQKLLIDSAGVKINKLEDTKKLVGKTVSVPSFLSTSEVEGAALHFARTGMMTIETNKKNKGINIEKAKTETVNREKSKTRKTEQRLIADYTADIKKGRADKNYADDYDIEAEYILPRNSKFKVKNIEEAKDNSTAEQDINEALHMDWAVKLLNRGGMVQRFVDGGIAQRKVGYIDYDVIANPDNEEAVKRGMEATGMSGPRLYTDHLTQLAIKARKDSNLQKLRAVYGVAGSGKTTLARGQGTDSATLRQTERFPILSPEDIQRATEVLVLSSSVSKDKLDNMFDATDRTYSLSSTTKEEKDRVTSQRGIRDATGVGLEGRKPGSTSSVATDTAVGEALLSDRLGDKSVVLGRSESGKLRRKSGNELVEVIKKKIGFTWGSFSPMTAGHESIMDAASAMGISPEDFIYLVGSNEGIKAGDPSSYRTAIFDQDFRMVLAKAGAGAKGATVLPKPRDFEVPQAFDISQDGSDRRKVLIPAKGSRTFVADKTPEQTKKYKEAGYSVSDIERTGGISGTMVRDLIMSGDMGKLQEVLSPGVYDIISNNIGRLQNRANVLPDIIEQVKANQGLQLADVEKQIKAIGITRIDSKKASSDPEYAAKAQILQELRDKRDKIKSAASFEPYRLLAALAAKEPEKYGLNLSSASAPEVNPIRTVSSKRPQRASIGGLIQKFMAGGVVEESDKMTEAIAATKGRNEILKVLGSRPNGLADTARTLGVSATDLYSIMGSRNPDAKTAALQEAIRREYVKTYNRQAGAAKATTTRLQNKGFEFGAAGVFGSAGQPENIDIASDRLKRSAKVRVISGVMDQNIASQLDSLFTSGAEELAQKAATIVGGGPPVGTTIPNPNAEASIQGGLLEKMVQFLGGPGKVKGQGFDFPDGLQGAAKYFNLPPDIPTDLKRTLEGPSTIKENIVTYLKNVMGYASGGKISRKVDFESGVGLSPFETPKSLIDYYSLEKTSGFNTREFDELVQYAKTNDLSLVEFQKYLSDRMSQKKQKSSLMMEPSSLQQFLLHGTRTPETTDRQKSLADSLKGPVDAKYNPKYDRAIQYAGGGPVNLYHGSNTGTNDSVLESFKKEGAKSGVAQGYGQGAGFYVYSGKEKAKEQAQMRVKSGLGSFAVVSGDTAGKPMVLTFKEILDPATWDLDYELNKGSVVKWLVDNFDKIKDKVAPKLTANEKLTGIKDIVKPDSSKGIMSSGVRVQSDIGSRSTIYSGTDSNIREGELIGQIMNRLQQQDPQTVYDFENTFFKSPSLASGEWNDLALKYVGQSPLKPTNIETFASGGSVPALVSNGEAYVPPKIAKKIGYGNLNRMNQADKNGMSGFASGGISIFKGPGSGTSDSIGPVGLPVGSFVIREKATKALGLNKGGAVGIQRFADGSPDGIGATNTFAGFDIGDKILKQFLGVGSKVTAKLTAFTNVLTLGAFTGLFKAVGGVSRALNGVDNDLKRLDRAVPGLADAVIQNGLANKRSITGQALLVEALFRLDDANLALAKTTLEANTALLTSSAAASSTPSASLPSSVPSAPVSSTSASSIDQIIGLKEEKENKQLELDALLEKATTTGSSSILLQSQIKNTEKALEDAKKALEDSIKTAASEFDTLSKRVQNLSNNQDAAEQRLSTAQAALVKQLEGVSFSVRGKITKFGQLNENQKLEVIERARSGRLNGRDRAGKNIDFTSSNRAIDNARKDLENLRRRKTQAEEEKTTKFGDAKSDRDITDRARTPREQARDTAIAADYFALRAKLAGESLDDFAASLKQQTIDLAEQLKNNLPGALDSFQEKLYSVRNRIQDINSSAKGDLSDTDKENIQQEKDSVLSSVRELLGSKYDDSRAPGASSSKEIADAIIARLDQGKSPSEAFDLPEFQNAIRSISTDDALVARAKDKISERYKIDTSKIDAKGSDLTEKTALSALYKEIDKTSSKMSKLSLIIGSAGSIMQKFFESTDSRSNAIASAAIGSGTSTASTLVAGGKETLDMLSRAGQMGGAVGGVVNSILPMAQSLIAGPFGIAAGAAISLGAAFKDAWNASIEFDKQLANKRVENSLNRIGTMFDEFSKDMSKKNILDDIANELNSAISSAFVGIKLDATVPKMFWTNMIDAAMGGSDAAQRSMILDKQGMGAYLKSTAYFNDIPAMIGNAIIPGLGGLLSYATGSGKTAQEKAARNRESYMFELAPQLAAQQSASLKPVADNALKLFEQKLRTGSSVDDIMKELKDAGGGVSQFAKAIARSNPIIEEQIIKTQARADLNDQQKQQIIEGIIAREAEKQTILNTTATMRAIEFEKLNKAVGSFVNSLERIYSNMEMSINKTSFEIQKLSDSAELANSSLKGEAKAGQTNLSAINVLQNRGTYSPEQQNQAVDLASSFFGSTSPAISAILNIGDKLESSILSTINKTRRAEPGATNERVLASIRSNLDRTLSDLQIPDNLAPKLSEEIRNALKDITTKGDLDNVTFDQIAEAVPGLTKQIDSARRAQEVAVKALEFYQNQLNEYANGMNQMVDLQMEANKDFSRASDIVNNSLNELSKVFGREISLRDIINNTLNKTKAQTGGATNPTDITRNIFNLENSRKILQEASSSAANKGPAGKDEFELMQNRLRNNNLALRQNYDALKNLAENTDIASAAMAKIQEIQAKRQSGASLIEKLVTSNPEELAKLNNAMGRLNNNMQGIANRGTTNEQRGESLQLFNQIAPLLGDGAKQNQLKANVLESQLLESGIGVSPMFAQILDSLRNPEGDPEMQEAISVYKQGVSLQAEANTKLGDLKQVMIDNNAEVAAQKLKTALTGTTLTFENKVLVDIRSEIINLRQLVEKRGPAAGLASGGVVYASAGQSIDFASKGTDTVPAMLTPGEFVVNRKATRNNLPLLQNINSGKYNKGGRVNYLADGGIVPGEGWTKEDKYDKFKDSERDKAISLSKASYLDVIKEPVESDQKDFISVPAMSFKTLESPQRDVFNTAQRNWFTQRVQSIPINLGPPTLGFSYGQQEYNSDGGLAIDVDYPHARDFSYKTFKTLIDINSFLSKSSKKITQDELKENVKKYQKIIDLIDEDYISTLKNNEDKFLDKPIDIPTSQLSIAMPSFANKGGPEKWASAKIKLDNLAAMDVSKNYLLNTDEMRSRTANNIAASIYPRGSWTGRSPIDITTPNNAGLSKDTIAANMPNLAKKAFNNKILDFAITKPSDNLVKLYNRLTEAIDNESKEKYDPSEEFQKKKTTISLLEDFANEKLFSIQLGESGTKEQTLLDGPKASNKDLPLTLYNISKNKWKEQIDKFKSNLEAAKNTGIDLSTVLPITEDFDADEANFIDLINIDGKDIVGKPRPWLSSDFMEKTRIDPTSFTSLGISSFDKEGRSQKLFGELSQPIVYGKENSMETFFTYRKVTAGTKYDPFRRQFVGDPIDYYVIDKQTNNESPFGEMTFGKLFIPEDSWKQFEEILTKQTDLNKPDGFAYKFTNPMGGFNAFDNSVLGDQYSSMLKNFIPYIVPNTINDVDIDAQKFKKTLKDRAADINMAKNIDMAKKGFDVTLGSDEVLTDAKKVGIARAVYDIGQNAIGIKAAKPTNMDSILPIIYELNTKLSKLAQNNKQAAPAQRTNNPAWLINDAYRAFFVELYKGVEGKQSTPVFLKGLGIPIDKESFDENTPVQAVPVKGRKGKKQKPYLDYKAGVKDSVKTAINNIINREMMLKSMSRLAGSLTDEEKQNATIKAGEARINGKDGKLAGNEQDIIPESFKDIFDIGLNPRNVFPTADFRTTNYLDVLADLYKNGTDDKGDLVFNVGDPQYLTASKSIDQLKKWYGTHQDQILNTSLTTAQLDQNKQLLVEGEAFDRRSKNLYAASQSANAFLTGNSFGQLPNSSQLSSLIDLNIKEPIKPVTKARGGFIYASAGQLVDFQPRGTDTVPAMLTPGEFVVNRTATQKNLPLLQSINSGTTKYSGGGMVYLENGGQVSHSPINPITGQTTRTSDPIKKYKINKTIYDYLTYPFVLGSEPLPDWLEFLNDLGTSDGNFNFFGDTKFAKTLDTLTDAKDYRLLEITASNFIKHFKYRDLNKDNRLSGIDFTSHLADTDGVLGLIDPDLGGQYMPKNIVKWKNAKDRIKARGRASEVIKNLTGDLEVFRNIISDQALVNNNPDSYSSVGVNEAAIKGIIYSTVEAWRNYNKAIDSKIYNDPVADVVKDIYAKKQTKETVALLNWLEKKEGAKTVAEKINRLIPAADASSTIDGKLPIMEKYKAIVDLVKNGPQVFAERMNNNSRLSTGKVAIRNMLSKSSRIKGIDALIKARSLLSKGDKKSISADYDNLIKDTFIYDDQTRTPENSVGEKTTGKGGDNANTPVPRKNQVQRPGELSVGVVAGEAWNMITGQQRDNSGLTPEQKAKNEQREASMDQSRTGTNANLMNSFNLWDLDKDGKISYEESGFGRGYEPGLVDFWQKSGIDRTMKTILSFFGVKTDKYLPKNVFDSIDKNTSGFIEPEEFGNMFNNLKGYMDIESSQEAAQLAEDLSVLRYPKNKIKIINDKLPKELQRAANSKMSADHVSLIPRVWQKTLRDKDKEVNATETVEKPIYELYKSIYDRLQPTQLFTPYQIRDEMVFSPNSPRKLNITSYEASQNSKILNEPVYTARKFGISSNISTSIVDPDKIGITYTDYRDRYSLKDLVKKAYENNDYDDISLLQAKNSLKSSQGKVLEDLIRFNSYFENLTPDDIINMIWLDHKSYPELGAALDAYKKLKNTKYKILPYTLIDHDMDEQKSVDPTNKSRGGIIYASEGRYINFQPKGTDTIPAMLTPGEFVVNKNATKNNLSLLQSINNGATGYRSGGIVYLAGGGSSSLLTERVKPGSKFVKSANEIIEAGKGIYSGSTPQQIYDDILELSLAIPETISSFSELKLDKILKIGRVTLQSKFGRLLQASFTEKYLKNLSHWTESNKLASKIGIVNDIDHVKKFIQSATDKNIPLDQKVILGADALYGLASGLKNAYKLDLLNKLLPTALSKNLGFLGSASYGNYLNTAGVLLAVGKDAYSGYTDQDAINQGVGASERTLLAGITGGDASSGESIIYDSIPKQAQDMFKNIFGNEQNAKEWLALYGAGFNASAKTAMATKNPWASLISFPIGMLAETRKVWNSYKDALSRSSKSEDKTRKMELNFKNKNPSFDFSNKGFNEIFLNFQDWLKEIAHNRPTSGMSEDIGEFLQQKYKKYNSKQLFTNQLLAKWKKQDNDIAKANLSKKDMDMLNGSDYIGEIGRVKKQTDFEAIKSKKKEVEPSPYAYNNVYASKGMLVPFQPKGTDTVPAMLTPGEFVVNRTATKKNLPLLQSINTGTYRNGGVVYAEGGGSTSPISTTQSFSPSLSAEQDLLVVKAINRSSNITARNTTLERNNTIQEENSTTLKSILNTLHSSQNSLDALARYTVPEQQLPQQNRSKGGLIYASNGRLIDFRPKGTDTVPAMLTPGEFVINRDSTQKYRPVIEAINNGSYSRGGAVNYLSNGGYLPLYRQRGGNSPPSAAFDFTKYLNGFATSLSSALAQAFDKAVNNLKQLNNGVDGVSTNHSDMTNIDNFVNRLNNIANILSNIYIPPQITMTGRHDVIVTINGDTVLNQLRPDLAKIVIAGIKGAFRNLKAKNPENNTIDFNIDISPKIFEQ